MKKDVASGINWFYSNHGCRSTFDRARKLGDYKTNCARFICWVLNAHGVLKPSQTFFGNNGSISWSGEDAKAAINAKCDIIAINGKYTVNQMLALKMIQPGDIVMYQNLLHTNMKANGNKWIDAGSAYQNGFGEGTKFRSWYGGLHYGNEKVSYIIRLKETARKYRVQCGAFLVKKNCQKLVNELKAQGFDAQVTQYGLRYIA